MPFKALVFSFLLSLFNTSYLLAQVNFGKAETINHSWKFSLDNVEKGESTDLNDSNWKTVNLPHDWSVKGQLSPTLASATGYLPGGIGWYRKHITIPSNRKGEKVYLYFEGVYNRSEVFINGHSVGKRPNGYISFMYDVTSFINYGQDNIVAVKVDHSKSADSRWYTGSGIYRNVWLVYANPIHIAQWGVYAYPKKLKKGYNLNIEVDVLNQTNTAASLTIVNELLSPEGKRVAIQSEKLNIKENQSDTLKTTINVKKPELWHISSPKLYTLNTKVLKEGELIDESNTKTGFRQFTFNSNTGFALNGTSMKVKGVCLHHDGGVLGAAVPKEVWKRRLLQLKKIGVNAIRTSHNPQAPDVYELCDELGLLVLNEAFDEWEYPKRKWIEGWNVGTPGYQGSYDFFDEWAEKDLANMVKRDRNHPSIFAWSIGNEVDYPNDPYSHPVLDGGSDTGFTQPIFGGYKKEAPDAMRLGKIAKRLVKVVKTYDTSRPVTAGLAGVAMSNQTEYPFTLDITGYNYTESLYDHDHVLYPNRVIFGSENRHELEAWNAVIERDFVFGQFLWTGIDYLGESGSWPSRGFYSGLLDFGGFIKPRGFFRQALWTNKPMSYLGTYVSPLNGGDGELQDVWSQLNASKDKVKDEKPSMDAWPIWNYKNQQLIRVVCYTNAPQAVLVLNNTIVGERQNNNNDTGILYWDIPYQEGTLEVIGMDLQGNEISHDAIKSSKRPYAIKIVNGDKQINTNGVAQITIQVVDENGVPVMISDDEVTCHIKGDATLLGLEASNNTDMSDYTDNKHRVYHGRMIAYIKAGASKEDILVTFTSPWLKSAKKTITVQD
ncbi:sugar-binding domain-containing protein [Mangrovimonas cancribranchiae]|uniref:Glycoside hydrolase family 2 TIM barrel-domain containing protein n=1 Tax=Mangrovimonas cancribranchiae TaxID=3080055 RepID=A0AAU6P0I8_9FLAO